MYVGGADREFRRSAAQRRVPAPGSPRDFGRAATRARADASNVPSWLAGDRAAGRRGRNGPRSLARALGVRARHLAALVGVDPPPPLGPFDEGPEFRIRNSEFARCWREGRGRAAADPAPSRLARPPGSATPLIVTGRVRAARPTPRSMRSGGASLRRDPAPESSTTTRQRLIVLAENCRLGAGGGMASDRRRRDNVRARAGRPAQSA